MASYVVDLSSPQAQEPALAGGKGAALARLLQADLPVPSGFVLTGAAYRRFLAEAGLGEFLGSAARSLSLQEPLSFYRVAEEVRNAFKRAPLPREVAQELLAAHRALLAAVGSDRFAVRSSATTEDLAASSAAGLHRSSINVRGEAALEEAVRDCYASLWFPGALRYRLERGLPIVEAAVAVIVQPLIAAEAAGVAFTADPITGDRSRVLITAAWGLGEGVVGGSGGADSFQVDRERLVVVQQRLGEKRFRWLPGDAGGVERALVPQELQRAPSLTDALAIEVARLALAAERLFGAPQDVEWAVHHGRVFLLQSRPITALPASELFTAALSEEERAFTWTLGGAEDTGRPKPQLPLERDQSTLFWRAWNTGRSASGARTLTLAKFIHGYTYSAIVPAEDGEVGAQRRLRAYAQRIEDCLARGTTLWEGEIRPEILANLARLTAFPLQECSHRALADHLEDVLRVYERHWELHWQMGGRQAVERFIQVYREITGETDDNAARALLQGVPTKTHETVAGLRALARQARRDPQLAALLRQLPPTEALAELRSFPSGRAFLDQLRTFLAEYGHRTGSGFGSTGTVATPTWWEEPAIALEVIARYLERDPDALEAAEVAQEHERQRRLAHVLAQATSPEQRERFLSALRLAEKDAAVMEDHNFYIEQRTGALLRYAFLEAGRRLAEAGALDQRDDVFFLFADETIAALRRDPFPDLRSLVAQRRAEWQRQHELVPPPYLGLPPARPRETTGLLEGGRLRGLPASPGRAIGRVRVVDMHTLVPAVEPGDVLVAANAGPMWTPMFPVLGGLVLDAGEVFQHAALVAREYRVPAVIQTRIATQVLRDGQLVLVDGTAGLVELDVSLEQEPPAETGP